MPFCTGYHKYQCADGDCQASENLCNNRDITFLTKKCFTSGYNFRCPDDECVATDVDCMRQCSGTKVNGLSYSVKCPGYEASGLCTYDQTSCPVRCSWYEFKCTFQKCADSATSCNPCYGYQCRSGQCTTYATDRCDSVRDCVDGSDEFNCAVGARSNNMSASLVIGLSVGSFILLSVIVFCIICCCRRKRALRGQVRRPTDVRNPSLAGAQPFIVYPTTNPAFTPSHDTLIQQYEPPNFEAVQYTEAPPPFGPQDVYYTTYTPPAYESQNSRDNDPKSDQPPSYEQATSGQHNPSGQHSPSGQHLP